MDAELHADRSDQRVGVLNAPDSVQLVGTGPPQQQDQMQESDMPPFTSVGEACVAFHDGVITERELTNVLVAFAPVAQAPLPDTSWYDAIIHKSGPVAALRDAHRARLITGPAYDRVIRSMLDAGHEA